MTAALEAVGLTKCYGERTVVDRLDLQVRRGEVFGLLGLNGAGKTTVIGMLTGRVRRTGGAASVAGIDVDRAADLKRLIGVVTQANTLDRSLDVHENLTFHGRYLGLSRRAAAARADVLIDVGGLADHRRARVDALSGGLAQRVMLARALVRDPAVLFLDEPTNGLDVTAQQDLWARVRALADAGVTVVVTTHRMDEAEQRCDRLGVLHGGALLAVGTPPELLAAAGEGKAVRVEVEGPVDAFLAAAGLDVLERHGTTMVLAAPDGDDALDRLVAAARAAGAHLRSVQVGTSSLESAFLATLRDADASGVAG